MFNNVGRKVMGLAKFICWAGIIISVIMAIAVWAGGAGTLRTLNSSGYGYSYRSVGGGAVFLYGLLILVLGCLFSWLGSLTTYAIGKAADDAENNRAKLNELENKLNALERKTEILAETKY